MKGKVCWALALLFLLSACGTDGARESPAESGYTFIFVCPIVGNEYWSACAEGIARADAELGSATTVVGPRDAENYAVEILDSMREAIRARPDGIITYASIAELVPLINEASEQGIPVLAIDSDAPDSRRVAYLGTDLYNLGYTAGESMVSLTGGEAHIGYLCSSFSAQSEQTVFNAFQDAIYDYDMEVIASAEGGVDADSAVRAAEKMLDEHPEIDAVFCTSSNNVTGFARVKAARGLDGLALVGLDDLEENLDFVRKGVIDTLLAQSPEQMGYESVRLIKSYVDNGALPREYYYTDTIVITQENVDTYADDGLFS